MDGQLAEVRIYTLAGCGACSIARRVLRRRGIEFEEVHGDTVPGFRRMLRETTGGASVPQVVIDGEPIGGADSLLVLDRRGALLPRLRREPFPAAVVRRRFSPLRLLTGAFSGGPWRHHVWLVDREGAIIRQARAASSEEAARLAEALRDEFATDQIGGRP